MLRKIKNHNKYFISSDGEVYRRELSGYFKLKPDYSNGYARVDIDGVKEYIGKMVLENFGYPKEDPSYRLFYIDGNKRNNNINNLIWLTPSQIAIYSTYTIEYRHKILNRGAR